MSFLLPASAGWNAGGIKEPGFSGTKKHRVNLPARALIPPTFSLQPSAFSFRV